jgi:DNA-directed RNA polymerase specialized sigma24 family protein
MKGKPAANAEPQAKPATSDEISRAIDALGEDALLRLKLFAQNRIYVIGPRAANGRSADDLLQEAVLRLLEGKRTWYPANVDLTGFLIGAVRSVASEWATHRARNKRKPEYAPLESERTKKDGEGNEISPFDTVRAAGLNVEELAVEADIEADAKALADEIEREFASDDAASMVLLGFQEGMKGPEIQKEFGWTPTEYRTTVRRIQRRADKIMERHYGK